MQALNCVLCGSSLDDFKNGVAKCPYCGTKNYQAGIETTEEPTSDFGMTYIWDEEQTNDDNESTSPEGAQNFGLTVLGLLAILPAGVLDILWSSWVFGLHWLGGPPNGNWKPLFLTIGIVGWAINGWVNHQKRQLLWTGIAISLVILKLLSLFSLL